MRRLFLIHGGALGDCVLALHFADAVRRRMAAEIFVVAARSSIVHWARNVGWIDEAVALDALRSRERSATSPERAGACDSEEPRCDVVVNMAGAPALDLLARLDASIKACVVTIDPREDTPKAEGGRHIVEQWLGRFVDRCAAQGIPGEALDDRPVFDPITPSFRVGHQIRSECRAALARELRVEGGRPIVVVHPGSGSARKCPPIGVMEAMVDALAVDAGVAIAWMIGPDEWERHGEAFHRRLARRAAVLWREDVQSAADLVAGADMYIGLDAGMTHVAAVCARRTMAIFGPTNPVVWRPVGDSCEITGFPGDGLDSSCTRGWLNSVREALR